ncbi:protein STAY-GREEN, chloroplastic-like [Momordica charantia]|uniref:Protein STAY-GREEN, chloroplastic-like n=1 Tax=Momordica charantia TaxID=3673 RepID=A0A6J1DUK4_MOMCH|nr:protein STAY-GREEN, chloroplastic-like [Momordica charantia]
MGVFTATSLLLVTPNLRHESGSSHLFPPTRKSKKKSRALVPVARLFGPAIFEASKLKVLFLGVDEKKHPGKFPRTYTLTHSDITSKLTLAVSHTINNSQLQGWYNWLQRDEVVAEWKKVKGKMSLHVHCHISGGHFLLDLWPNLRYFIFRKELPVVLNAFVHGDVDLFNNYPELQESLVWVYFHSKIPEFNKVECWGPLKDPAPPSNGPKPDEPTWDLGRLDWPKPCQEDCSCCFPAITSISWSPKNELEQTS